MNYKLVYICSPLRPILTNEPERTEELKVDDNGIFCGVRFPESRSHDRCDDVGRRNNACVDDDEEGLIYDGD